MNILTDEEIFKCLSASIGTLAYARAIESAVLSKLAEQDMEPVAYQSTRNGFIAKEDKNPEYNIGLYTEAQLLAEQQRTAEACAESVRDAARYRYLREWWFCGPEGSIRNALCPDELDAEIDAAIGKEK